MQPTMTRYGYASCMYSYVHSAMESYNFQMCSITLELGPPLQWQWVGKSKGQNRRTVKLK